MRVLLISHTCQSRREGQPKAHWLARQPGIELMVLIPDRWKAYGKWIDAEVPENPAFRYEIARVRWPWVGKAQNYLHHYPSLKQTLLEFRPDVIDLWEEPWGLVSVHAVTLRNRLLPKTKLVSETEQNLEKTLPPPFEWFRSYTLRHADFLVGRSDEAVEVARRKGYRGPAESVPNAVDETLFRPLDRDACRSQVGVGGFVVGYIGRLVLAKGLSDLLDAVARCDASVRCVLVGGGPDEAVLREQTARLGIAGRVTFAGPKPMAELPVWMNAMDVLVLPSRTTPSWKEQFGRVIIEAHACGTPVIGSSSGAIPEVVGEGGLVFPEGRADALADRIEAMRSDPARAHAAGERGREVALARYTWQRVAEQMARVYHKLA
jgi:glycosyltransferase involved in cell wall biosynthesis